MNLRILIADDEKMARKRAQRLIETLGHQVVASCRSGEEAVSRLDPALVDVAILDIQMPGLDGLETASVAKARGVPVIFVTAHAEHAVQAFEQDALHYLLKPLEIGPLAHALSRVSHGQANDPPPPKRLSLQVRGEVRLVHVHDVSHAVFDGSLVTLVVSGEPLCYDQSLQELEQRLGPAFVRVNRRALIHFDHVVRLRPLDSGGYMAVLDEGSEIRVSRAAARTLRKRLGL